MTLRLSRVLKPEVKKLGLVDLEAMELRLIPVLADMEMAGVGVDVGFLNEMSIDLERRLAKLEAQIHEIAGEPFNINSTQQLSDSSLQEARSTARTAAENQQRSLLHRLRRTGKPQAE